MENGGYTEIFKRVPWGDDNLVPCGTSNSYFDKTWIEYEQGFLYLKLKFFLFIHL